MNEEQKPIMTQAELEARVQQFRQELRDAAAAEEATKQTVGEVTPTPGPVPQPKEGTAQYGSSGLSSDPGFLRYSQS